MRPTTPFRLAGPAVLCAAIAACATLVAHAARPAHDTATVRTLRALVEHYRALTWTYERAARAPRSSSSFDERRTTDVAYLQWTVDRWTSRAYAARSLALTRVHRGLDVAFPRAPRLRAPLSERVAYARRVTLRLRRIYPGAVSHGFASARLPEASATLRLWQLRSARAALAVARHAVLPRRLVAAFTCIHRYEGAWDANTGNGYYGGLQMDLGFQRRYGASYLRRYGTADRWPPWAQLEAAARAYRSGRGFWPWPNTARACGLL